MKHQSKLKHNFTKNSDKFMTTNRQLKKGDYWLAKFPYFEKGNFEKLRPVKILAVDEEANSYIVQKITSNPEKGKEIQIPSKKKQHKKSYLTNYIAKITIDKFYHKL